jgi:hypothetical protein
MNKLSENTVGISPNDIFANRRRKKLSLRVKYFVICINTFLLLMVMKDFVAVLLYAIHSNMVSDLLQRKILNLTIDNFFMIS